MIWKTKNINSAKETLGYCAETHSILTEPLLNRDGKPTKKLMYVVCQNNKRAEYLKSVKHSKPLE